MELLVVISLIVVLISLILPSMGRARDHARKAACLSNARQIMITVDSYSINNEGYLPLGPRQWPHSSTIDFYETALRSMSFNIEAAHCPADQYEPGAVAYWWRTWWKGSPINAGDHLDIPPGVNAEPSYSYYWYYKMYQDVDRSAGTVVGGAAGKKAWRLESLNYPSHLIALACWGHNGTGPGDAVSANLAIDADGGFYSGFIDQHAEFVSVDRIEPANWGHIYNLDWTYDGIMGRDVSN